MYVFTLPFINCLRLKGKLRDLSLYYKLQLWHLHMSYHNVKLLNMFG